MNKEELVLDHIFLAQILAKKQKKVNKNFTYDEILSAAYFGLVQAAEKFNPIINDNFNVYANFKIRSAIFDYFRETCQFSRHINKPKISSIQEEIEQQKNSNTLEDLLEELPERNQKIIDLYYFQGYKLKEIAVFMKLNESRISQILSESKKHLQLMLF